jgi:hypothetical protein
VYGADAQDAKVTFVAEDLKLAQVPSTID